MRTIRPVLVVLGLTFFSADFAWADIDTGTLAEVVVTAQKRSENLTQVPIAITVVTPETLAETNSKNLSELEGVIPGVTFQGDRSYGGVNIAMRGTSGSTAPLQDDPVAIYVDGVYVSSNYFGVTGLTDIASLEVVRGPQGTLQGRNATAGAILVHTADPSSEAGGYVDAYAAAPAQGRVQAAFTGPLLGSLDGRISLDHFDDRGWAKNYFNGDYLGGSESTTVRGVLRWTDGAFKSRLAVGFERYTAHEDLAPWAVHLINPVGQAVTIPTPGTSLSPPDQRSLENGHFFQDIPTGYTTNLANAALQLGYSFGPAEIVSITGANRSSTEGETDSTGLALLPRGGFNTATISGDFVSEELRLQSVGDNPLRWLIGGYGSIEDGSFNFNINNLMFTVPTRAVSIFNAHQRDPSAAAFADMTYHITPQIAVTGGVRYTDESKTFRNDFTSESLTLGRAVLGPLYFTPPKATWHDTSYRAQVAYTPDNDTLFYASHSTGFKSGGYNAFTVGSSAAVNPETLASTEVGAKADLLNRRLHVGASVYYNRYDNLQVSVGVPAGGVATENAATATIKGVELEGKALLADHFTIDANAAYTDGRYDRFANSKDIFGVTVDSSGNRLISTPQWQFFLQGSYDYRVSDDWRGLAQLNWRWRDRLYFEPTNQNLWNLQSPPDGELGTRFRFENSRLKLWAALYGENLNDRRVINSLALAFSSPLVSFNRPRTIGVEVHKEF